MGLARCPVNREEFIVGTERSRRGFTLIELLVVVAMIALLAAILFPVFAQAREKARQAACLSNLQQVGMGVLMYAQDYDEKLPFGYQYHWSAPGQRIDGMLDWWQDLCRPYVKNEEVYSCPSQHPHLADSFWRRPGDPDPVIRDYIANASWGVGGGEAVLIDGIDYGQTAGRGASGPFINNWYNDSKSLAEIEEPAGTIAIFDGGMISSDGRVPGFGWGFLEIYRGEQTDAYHHVTGQCAYGGNSPRPSMPGICENGHVGKRHNGGFNAAFVDGHARWMRNSTLGMWTMRAGD
jgi:prepilin-type N-terminal cleavage/methylation domain-containing protein/prepilin-type processing-associated H-X9-DG protein